VTAEKGLKRRFASNREVRVAVKEWFPQQPASLFAVVYRNLRPLGPPKW